MTMSATAPRAPNPAPLLAVIDRALFAVEWVTAAIGGLAIFVLMMLISADVVLRGAFAEPIHGQVDFTMMSMVTFGVLCISYCYRRAGHIRMDLLVTHLGGRARWVAELFVTLIGLMTISLILPGSWTHFVRAWELGDTTFGVGLVTWPSKLAVPIGLGILWLRLALEIWVFGRLIADPDAEQVAVPAPPPPKDDIDV